MPHYKIATQTLIPCLSETKEQQQDKKNMRQKQAGTRGF